MKRAGRTGLADASFSVADILEAVPVSLSQVAEWTGISRRQLAYWINQRILPAEPRPSAAMVQQAMLIKAELDRDIPLRRAAAKAEALLQAARALNELEERAPVDQASALIRQRIDGCLAALVGIDRTLSDLTDDEVAQVLAAIHRFRQAMAGGERLPGGFLVLADQFVESLSTSVAVPLVLTSDELPIAAGAS